MMYSVNRVGNSEFVSDEIDGFLQDVAQMFGGIDYNDIMSFEDDVYGPGDGNVQKLQNLYTEWCEAGEINDEEAAQEIANQVAEIVTGVADFTEDSIPQEGTAILGNCSCCGATPATSKVDTVENFLKQYGFEDIEYSCDILDIDPLEEVCEECFKSWLPELNDKTYSEYDDLGTDTRTGEPFGAPIDEKKKRTKKSIKEEEEKVAAKEALDLYGNCSLSDGFDEDEWKEIVETVTPIMRKAFKEVSEKCQFTLGDDEENMYADELTRYLLSDDINDNIDI